MATAASSKNLTGSVQAGIIAGLIGGLVFGVMMAMMDMLPMVGMLVGLENAVVGFIVHMIISAIIGAIYSQVAVRLPQSWGMAAVAGLANGFVWWVLGALILMPLMLGMAQMVFVIGEMQWMSLLGHFLYGLVTAFAFIPLNQRF